MDNVRSTLEEYRDNDSVLFADDLSDDWEVIDEGDWCQEHKYQTCAQVIQHIPTGRYFTLAQSRSGSYHTDWYYDETEVFEVQKEIKMVEQVTWKAI